MDAIKERALKRQIIPAIAACPHLNQDRLDDMLRLAESTLALHLKPGNGPSDGWQFRDADVKAFIRDMQSRPGFAVFDAGDHNEASPLDRLKRANRR